MSAANPQNNPPDVPTVLESLESLNSAEGPVRIPAHVNAFAAINPRKRSLDEPHNAFPAADSFKESDRPKSSGHSNDSAAENIEDDDDEESNKRRPPEKTELLAKKFAPPPNPPEKERKKPGRGRSPELFAKLCAEKLRHFRPRSGSPKSRKEIVEELELAECNFRPELGPLTKELAKEGKERRQIDRIDELLYEDARRRKQRKQVIQDNSLAGIKKESTRSNVTLTSYKIVREKLLRDLNTAMEFVKRQNKSHYVTFDMLGQFMHNVGIYKILFNPAYHVKLSMNGDLEIGDERYKSNKFALRREREIEFQLHFWQMMSQTKVPMIEGELAVELVLILFDLGANTVEELSESVEQLLQAAYREYRLREDPAKAKKEGQPTLWRGRELVKTFKALNEAKYTAETSNFLKSHNILKQSEQTYSFKPEINHISRRLDEQHTEKYMSEVQSSRNEENIDEIGCEAKVELSLHRSASGGHSQQLSTVESGINARIMRMYENQKKRNEWIKAERTKSKYKELEGCTFKPALQSRFELESKRPVNQQRAPHNPRKDNFKSKEEKDLEECTFRPQINKKRAGETGRAPNGYEKVVSRLRVAKEEKNRRTQLMEKIPAGENYEKRKKMRSNPPRTFYEKKPKVQADLYIDVNIAAGKSGRIAVNRGDDPEVLAGNFAKMFHLNRTMKDALVKLLEENIKTLLVDDAPPSSESRQ